MIRRLLLNQSNYDQTAVIENDKETSYGDLLQKAWTIKRLLSQKNNSGVALLLPNGSDYIIAFWGTIFTGLVVFPLNILLTKYELFHSLKQANITTVITTLAYQHLLNDINVELKAPLNVILMDNLEPTILETNDTIENFNCEEPMLLLGTSGTTGKVKIVQLSEKNVETAVLGYLDKLHYHDMDNVRYTMAIPYSTAYGIMIICACLMKSFPIITLNNHFTLDNFYDLTAKQKITHYEGSASIILLMAQTIHKSLPYDIDSLKYFGFGGSKVSSNIIEKLLNAYPDKGFYQGYGMTEAAPLIAKHSQTKSIKTGSVGNAIKGVEIGIDANSNITKLPNVEGEIVIRGDNVMLGYLDNLSESALVLKNGYLYTGDIGYLDNEGFLYICGRQKNIVIVRGFNVYPEEVEDCIFNSNLVCDCLVYGQSDDDGNEILCADIVPLNEEITAEQIRIYCQTHLAFYKWPKKISFRQHIDKNTADKKARFK